MNGAQTEIGTPPDPDDVFSELYPPRGLQVVRPILADLATCLASVPVGSFWPPDSEWSERWSGHLGLLTHRLVIEEHSDAFDDLPYDGGGIRETAIWKVSDDTVELVGMMSLGFADELRFACRVRHSVSPDGRVSWLEVSAVETDASTGEAVFYKPGSKADTRREVTLADEIDSIRWKYVVTRGTPS